MTKAHSRQPSAGASGPLVLTAAIVCFLIFAGLGGYFYYVKHFDDYAKVEDFSDGAGNKNLKEDAPFSWPGYLGPDRNATSKETGLLATWPDAGPKVVWDAKLGGGYSSMAIARGRLVTMYYETGNEVVICLNADTGKPIWQRSYKASYKGQDGRFNQGPRSTPAIDDNRVYAVGATGTFICLQLKDGKELWKHNLNEEYDAEPLLWGMAFSPLVYKDLVITNPGGDKGSIVAFDKETGKEVWKTGDEKASYCSPIIVHAQGQDQVVIFNQTGLVSVSANDGSDLWEFPWTTQYKLNITTPLWIDDHLFISTGYGAGCARLKITKNAEGDLSVKTVYKNKELSNHFSNSIYYDGCIYGFDRDKDGHFVCLDYATGKVKWRQEKYGRGQLLLADGRIIVQREGAEDQRKDIDAQLVLLEPTPQEYKPISSFVFSHQSKCWAAPALANGKLYVRDNEKVICYDLHQ